MHITCPQCHIRCRLKTDTEINDSSQGKCPECGHIFIIPPGTVRENPTNGERSEKSKKTWFTPSFKTADITKIFHNPIQAFRKIPFVWLISGLAAAVILSTFFFGSENTQPTHPQQNLSAKRAHAIPPALTKPSITSVARTKAIDQIKHHTLVGDADISIANNQLQLALLVAGNTPVAYAERLGRQFAHYVKAQLTATDQPRQKPDIKVSVYYPSGTRIEVATNDQSGDEEILPQMINN